MSTFNVFTLRPSSSFFLPQDYFVSTKQSFNAFAILQQATSKGYRVTLSMFIIFKVPYIHIVLRQPSQSILKHTKTSEHSTTTIFFLEHHEMPNILKCTISQAIINPPYKSGVFLENKFFNRPHYTNLLHEIPIS